MLMVTLVIGLAFLAVGLFTKNSMERRSDCSFFIGAPPYTS